MRRPTARTFIAWLFILVGTAGLLKDLLPLWTANASQQLAKLQADGWTDLGPAWTLRLLAVVGGVGLLRGQVWARWLLAAWMAIHLGISLFHSLQELLLHAAIFALIAYGLFKPAKRFCSEGQRTADA